MQIVQHSKGTMKFTVKINTPSSSFILPATQFPSWRQPLWTGSHAAFQRHAKCTFVPVCPPLHMHFLFYINANILYQSESGQKTAPIK